MCWNQNGSCANVGFSDVAVFLRKSTFPARENSFLKLSEKLNRFSNIWILSRAGNKQEIGKELVQNEFFAWMHNHDFEFSRTKIRLVSLEPPSLAADQPDAIFEVLLPERVERYVVEFKSQNHPQAIRGAIDQARFYAKRLGLHPMIIVPYLSPDSLTELDEAQVSGIDLNGNGLIVASGVRLFSTGQPNRFKDSGPLQNAYDGDSSVVARCFLLRKEYDSLSELHEFANERLNRGVPNLSIGTVSKAVKLLAKDLVIHRQAQSLKLVDARSLLRNLRRGYRPPKGFSLEGRSPLSRDEIWNKLSGNAPDMQLRYVATGIASSSHYGVLFGVDKMSLYVNMASATGQLLELREGRAFSNVELIETGKNFPYFDARTSGKEVWASPIQTWLELSDSGPREQEASDSLEESLRQGRGSEL